jgi:dCTP deaminase
LILSRSDILTYLDEGKIGFDPAINRDQVAQCSVDLHLGNRFTVFKVPPAYLTSIQVDKSLWESEDLWQHYEQDEFLLNPGGFVLAQTLESVYIPPDLVGLVEGRSSWARIGVTIHVTSPKIDPGFNSHITLEMSNLGLVPVKLRAGIDQPAQLMFVKLSSPVAECDLYGTGPDDMFQGQESPIPHKGKPITK